MLGYFPSKSVSTRSPRPRSLRPRSPRRWRVLLLCVLAFGPLTMTGCETMTRWNRRLWHEMQPHRLHRWNQGPGPATSEAVYMSIPPEQLVKPQPDETAE